jgi:hypothetical protein
MKNSIKILLASMIGLIAGGLITRSFLGITNGAKEKTGDPWGKCLEELKSDFENSLKTEGFTPSYDKSGQKEALYKYIQEEIYSFSSSSTSEVKRNNARRIRRDTAEMFVRDYQNDPFGIYIKEGNCDGKRITGWFLGKAEIDDMLKWDSLQDGLEFFIARQNVKGVSDQLTLVVTPVKLSGQTQNSCDHDNGELIISNYDHIFEYLRPCPPRCPQKKNPFEQ